MKNEKSFGIIPLRLWSKQWQVLLVQHHSGYWAFPKGHQELGETPLETAERELFEETGLNVETYLSTEAYSEHYFFRHHQELINKKVDYFIAKVSGKVVLQQEEIQACQWLPLNEAVKQITFEAGKSLCSQVIEFLELHNLRKG
jgi:8-oxo-dGTP pyrophosphatase MutT (NUDIX family)